MAIPIPTPVLKCAACHTLAIPGLHCDTPHGCEWWVCAACDAPNDGDGRWAIPKRHVGNLREALAWATHHGIKAEFIETPPKGKSP